MKKDVQNLRRDLNFDGLEEKKAADNPFEQFAKWFAEAMEQQPYEPNAMTLSTSNLQGQPTSRTVLLKDFDEEGFVFYTNQNSRKGRDLLENPQASLVFYWGSLSRQILIDGSVVIMNRESTIEYFHARPRKSQIAALVSYQSETVESREVLEQKVREAETAFEGKDIPCPEHWNGFCLKPTRVEFWQGRQDRLHDRLCYTLNEEHQWTRTRLYP